MTLNVQKCLYNSEFLIESEARIVGIANEAFTGGGGSRGARTSCALEAFI